MTVPGRALRRPRGARPRAPRPSRGGGGGAPLEWRGGTGPMRPSRPLAFRGRGGGRAAVVQSLCPPPAPRFISPAAARAGLKAQVRAPPTVGFPCMSGGGSTLPGPRSTGAPAYVGDHCLVGALSLAPCDVRVAGGGACARVAPCAPPCDVLGQGCPASSGARCGPGD